MIQLAKNSDTQQGQPQANSRNEVSSGNNWVNTVGSGSSSSSSNTNQSKDTSDASYQEFSELLQELLEVGEMEDETGTSTSKDYNLLCMDLDNSPVGSPERNTVNADKTAEKAPLELSEVKTETKILETKNKSAAKTSLKNETSEKSTAENVKDRTNEKIVIPSNSGIEVVSLPEVKMLETDYAEKKETNEISSVFITSAKEATSDPQPADELKLNSETKVKPVEEKCDEGSCTMVPSTEVPAIENLETKAIPEANSSTCYGQPQEVSSPVDVNKEGEGDSTQEKLLSCDDNAGQSRASKRSSGGETDSLDSNDDCLAPSDKKVKTNEKVLENANEASGQKNDESQPSNDHLPVVKVLIVVDNKVVVCSSNQNLVNNEMKDIDKILQYIPDVSKSNIDEKTTQSNCEKTISSAVTAESSVSSTPSLTDSLPTPAIVTSTSTTTIASSSSSTLVTSATTTTLVQTTTLVTSSTSLVPHTSTTTLALTLSTQSVPSLSKPVEPLASSQTITPSSSSSASVLVPLVSSTETSTTTFTTTITSSNSSTVASSPCTSVVLASTTALTPTSTSLVVTSAANIPSMTLVSSTTTSVPSIISSVPATSAPCTATSHSVSSCRSESTMLPLPSKLAAPTALAPHKLVPESFESSPVSNISPCPAEVDKCSSECKKSNSEVKILNAKTCQNANFSSYGKSLWLRGIRRLKQQQLALKIAEIKQLVHANSMENFIDVHEKNTHLNKAFSLFQCKDFLLKGDEKDEGLLLSADIPHDINAPISMIPEIYKDLPLPTPESDSVKPLSIEEKRKLAKTIYLKVKELMTKYTHNAFSRDVHKSSLVKELNISENDLNKVSAPWPDLQNEPKDSSVMTICNKFSDDIPPSYIPESNEGGEALPQPLPNRDEKWDYPSFTQLQNYSWNTDDKMRSHSFSPHQNNTPLNVVNVNYSSVKRKIQETIIKKQTQIGKMGASNTAPQTHLNDMHSLESNLSGIVKKPKLSEETSLDSPYTAEPITKNVGINENLNMGHASSIHFSPEDNSAITDNVLKENSDMCSQESSVQPVSNMENELPYLQFSKPPPHESVIKTLSTNQMVVTDKSYENHTNRPEGCPYPVEPTPYYNTSFNQKPSGFTSQHPSMNYNSSNTRPSDLHQSCQTQMFMNNRSYQHQQMAVKDFYEKSASEQRETVHMSFSHNSTFESSHSKSQYENSHQSYYSTTNREFVNSEEIHKMKSHYSSVSHHTNLVNPQDVNSHHYRNIPKNVRTNDNRYFPSHYPKSIDPVNSGNMKVTPEYSSRSEYMNKSDYPSRSNYSSSPLFYPEENINSNVPLKHLPDIQNPSDFGTLNSRPKEPQDMVDYCKSNVHYKPNASYQYSTVPQDSKLKKDHPDFNRGNFGTLPHNQINHNNYYSSNIAENRHLPKPDLSREVTSYSFPKIPSHQNEMQCNNSAVIMETNAARISNHLEGPQTMMYPENNSRATNCPSDYNNSDRQMYSGMPPFVPPQNRIKYDEPILYSEDKNSNYSDHFDEAGLFINDTSCQSSSSLPAMPYEAISKTANPEPFSPPKITQREDSTHYNSNFSDISSDDNLQHILNETDFALSLPPISTILAMKGQMDGHEKPQELDSSESTVLTSNSSRTLSQPGSNEKYQTSNLVQQKEISSVYPNYSQFKTDDNYNRSQGNQINNTSFTTGSDLSESNKYRPSSNYYTSSNSNNSSYDNWHYKNTYQDLAKTDKQNEALTYLEMQKRNFQNDKDFMQWENEWPSSTAMSTSHSFSSKQKNTMDYQGMGYYTSTEESPLPMMNPFSKRMFEKQERYNASLQNVKSAQLYAKKKEAQKYFTNVLPVRRKRGRPRKIRTDDCLYPTQKSIIKRQKREKPSSWMQHLLNFSSNFILEQKLKEEMNKKKGRHSVKNLSNYPRNWHIPPLQIPQHFYFANNKYSQNNATPQNVPPKEDVNQINDQNKKSIFGNLSNLNPTRDIFSKSNDTLFSNEPEKNSSPSAETEKSENFGNFKLNKNGHYNNQAEYKDIDKVDTPKLNNQTQQISEESESEDSLSSEDSPSSSYSSSSEYSDNDNTYQIIHPEQTEQSGKNQFHLNKIIIRKVSRAIPKSNDTQSKNVTKKEHIKSRDKVHIEVERKESGPNQFSSVIDMHIEAEAVGSSSKEIKKCTQGGEMVSRIMKEGRSISVRVGLSSNLESKDIHKFSKEPFEKAALGRGNAMIKENSLSMDSCDKRIKEMETSIKEKHKSKSEAVFSSQNSISVENGESNRDRSSLLSPDIKDDKHSSKSLPSFFSSNERTDHKEHSLYSDHSENKRDKFHSSKKIPEEKEKYFNNKQSLQSPDNSCEVSRYSSEGYKYRVVVEIKDTIAETILEQSINIGKQNDSQGANIPKIKIDVTKTKHVLESVVNDQVTEPLINENMPENVGTKDNCEMLIQETVKSAEIKMKHWASSENLSSTKVSPNRASYLKNQEQIIKQSQIKDCTVRLQRVDSLIENGKMNVKSFSQAAPVVHANNTFHNSNPTEYLKQSKRKLTLMVRRKTLSLNKKNMNDGTEATSKLHDYKRDTEYNCPICNLKTKDILQILLHITKHGYGLPKICPICYKSFPSEVLSCHIHCQHSRTNQGNACQMCGELLDGLANLQEHLHIIHLRCMFCGIMRMKKAALYNHIITSHVPEIKKMEALHQDKPRSQDFLENINDNNYHVLTEWLASSSSDLSDDCESGSDSPSDWGHNSRKRILTRKWDSVVEALETSSSQSEKSPMKDDLPVVGDTTSDGEASLSSNSETSPSTNNLENEFGKNNSFNQIGNEECFKNQKEKTTDEKQSGDNAISSIAEEIPVSQNDVIDMEVDIPKENIVNDSSKVSEPLKSDESMEVDSSSKDAGNGDIEMSASTDNEKPITNDNEKSSPQVTEMEAESASNSLLIENSVLSGADISNEDTKKVKIESADDTASGKTTDSDEVTKKLESESVDDQSTKGDNDFKNKWYKEVESKEEAIIIPISDIVENSEKNNKRNISEVEEDIKTSDKDDQKNGNGVKRLKQENTAESMNDSATKEDEKNLVIQESERVQEETNSDDLNQKDEKDLKKHKLDDIEEIKQDEAVCKSDNDSKDNKKSKSDSKDQANTDETSQKSKKDIKKSKPENKTQSKDDDLALKSVKDESDESAQKYDCLEQTKSDDSSQKNEKDNKDNKRNARSDGKDQTKKCDTVLQKKEKDNKKLKTDIKDHMKVIDASSLQNDKKGEHEKRRKSENKNQTKLLQKSGKDNSIAENCKTSVSNHQENEKVEVSDKKENTGEKNVDKSSEVSKKTQSMEKEKSSDRNSLIKKAVESCTSSKKEQDIKADSPPQRRNSISKVDDISVASKNDQKAKQDSSTNRRNSLSKLENVSSASKNVQKATKQDQAPLKRNCSSSKVDVIKTDQKVKQDSTLQRREASSRISEASTRDRKSRQDSVLIKGDTSTKITDSSTCNKDESGKKRDNTPHKKNNKLPETSSKDHQKTKQDPVKKDTASKVSDACRSRKDNSSTKKEVGSKRDASANTSETSSGKDQKSKQEVASQKKDSVAKRNKTVGSTKEDLLVKKDSKVLRKDTSAKAFEETLSNKDQTKNKRDPTPQKKDTRNKESESTALAKIEKITSKDKGNQKAEKVVKNGETGVSNKTEQQTPKNKTSQKKDNGNKNNETSTLGKGKEAIKDKLHQKKDNSSKKEDISMKNDQNSKDKQLQKKETVNKDADTSSSDKNPQGRKKDTATSQKRNCSFKADENSMSKNLEQLKKESESHKDESVSKGIDKTSAKTEQPVKKDAEPQKKESLSKSDEGLVINKDDQMLKKDVGGPPQKGNGDVKCKALKVMVERLIDMELTTQKLKSSSSNTAN